jgi:hypothetical protein
MLALENIAQDWCCLHQPSFEYFVEGGKRAWDINVVAALMVTDAQRDIPRKWERLALTFYLEINHEFFAADVAGVSYQERPPESHDESVAPHQWGWPTPPMQV